MIAYRAIATAFFLMTLGTSTARSAPPFSAVTEGFEGTSFRGVALGQTIGEVEAALGVIGKRCYTDEEVFPVKTPEDRSSLGKLYVESVDGYSTCRISRPSRPLDFTAAGGIDFLTAELIFGMPIYAVSFLEGRAAAISLTPDYFNANAASPLSFAQSIAENYHLREFEPTKAGWRGVTNHGELVQVWRGSTRVPLWMTVVLTTDANTPTFD